MPPAVAKDYKEKGKFVEIGGLKTCMCLAYAMANFFNDLTLLDATGPSSATSAILIIYDIFGFSPQALQGADILAHADDEHHQYQVYMPDFFEGKPAGHDWYPPDTKEKGEKLGAFFQGPAAPPKNAEKVPQLVEAIKKYSPKIEKSGVLGMCWGGKVSIANEYLRAYAEIGGNTDCISDIAIRDCLQRCGRGPSRDGGPQRCQGDQHPHLHVAIRR